jgi:acyl-[acyl-carrier-protein]-phospholipid O-acyltransferase / long-chain-fatty-acid--[acyl-carrier-protein] ligase
MTVQVLNAFGDNLVKMLLVSLGLAVAKGTVLGDSMQVYMGMIFSVPYVLLAPVAGFLSDRFSKRSVILWTQVMQMACYIAFVLLLKMENAGITMWVSLVFFFLLATQATMLSPAKSGVMKELAGSRRLGLVNGLLQMAMFAGILSGIGLAGPVFKALLDRGYSNWDAVLLPLYGCMALNLIQIFAGWAMLRTPSNPALPYSAGLWGSHFKDLSAAFRVRAVGLAVMGTTFFWFISYGLGSVLINVGKERFPTDVGRASEYASYLSAALGVSVMLGGVVAGFICRKRVELGIVPLGGLGMAVSMISVWFLPMGSWWIYAAMGGVGLFGGMFMVPLTSFIQDRSAPEERARVLSSANLLDCLIGGLGSGVAVLFMSKGLALCGLLLSATAQIAVFGCVMLLGSIWITRLLPQDIIRVTGRAILKSIYKVKSFNMESLPKEGGVLLLPNHVSYVDALIVAAVCERPVRFVIWDVLYRVWWLNGFLRLFGTVPISQKRAKDAIRSVAEALQRGEVVCLFPEGELTHTGQMNELQKGFELILRQAQVPAMPVYVHGLWGSIFSWEGGRVFSKWPKKLRYPVEVHFGPVLPPSEATTARVTEELCAMRDRRASC